VRKPYVVATAAVLASALIRLALAPVLANEAPMLAFVFGVAISAMYGGFQPGIYATAASAVVGHYFFIAPRFEFSLALTTVEFARMGLFIFEGVVISYAGGRVRREAEELEAEVRSRTTELERSNEALETFAHTISHDIRAPLRSIRGFAEIIEMDFAAQLPDEGREYTGRIAAAAHRLEALVNNLLAYTRLGRAEVLPDPVSLDRLADEVQKDLGDEIRHSQARVDVSTPLGSVVAHRETLGLVLTNLVSNALKYVPPGRPPIVQISTAQRDGAVRLSVRDNGIGVAPSDRARIFKPFERLHSRHVYAGSGLGLALVARGVERMGGRCGVESSSDGSEFWVELPAAQTGAP
jgi:signal transduction histidine kinase